MCTTGRSQRTTLDKVNLRFGYTYLYRVVSTKTEIKYTQSAVKTEIDIEDPGMTDPADSYSGNSETITTTQKDSAVLHRHRIDVGMSFQPADWMVLSLSSSFQVNNNAFNFNGIQLCSHAIF